MDIEIKNLKAGMTEQQTNAETVQKSLTSVKSDIDLLSMPDDCLLEIFFSESLTVRDFCSVGESCMRFQQLLQSAVPKRLTIYNNKGNGVYNVSWQHFTKYTENEVERVLKSFAPALSDLSLWDFEAPHLVKVAFDKCGPNLQTLKIFDSFLPKITTVNLTQLTYLQLGDVNIEPNASFAGLISLVELRMARVRNGKAILLNKFTHLKHFSYDGSIRTPRILLFSKLLERLRGNTSKIADSSKVLSIFFQSNRALKTVDLRLSDFADKDIIVLKEIANSCKELDVLRVNCGKMICTDFIAPMKSSKPLRYLELSDESCKNLDIFPSLTTFRSLCLYSCVVPMPSQFGSLIQMTRLELEALQSADKLDVVGIIRQLVNLEVLNINVRMIYAGIPFVLDEKTFEDIVAVVKSRENVLTMQCKTKFVPKDFDVEEKIRLIRLRPDLLY